MPLEYPDQSYYPSWKMRLRLRLEEFDSGVVKARVPSKLTKNLNGIKTDSGNLEAVPDPEHSGRFIVRQKGGSPDQDNLVPDTSDDGLSHKIEGVIPKNFSWKQAGFRSSGELKATIRWSDLPIDPRVIRSCAVEFYLGTVTALEYAQGVQGKTRTLGTKSSGQGEPLNVVPDTYLDDSGNKRTNLRFQGWVEEFKASWSDDEPVVELTCKDNSSLFMNQVAPPRMPIGGKDPLDKAIATYLTNFPQLEGITVEFRGNPGETAPSLDKVLAGTAFRPQLGPPPAKGGGDDLSVWDYITDVCGALSLKVYLDGTNLLIVRPSTVLDGRQQARSDDPYHSRKLASGEFPQRAMIFGKNIMTLDITRKFGLSESKNIEMRCYSTRRKQLLVSRYPGKDDRVVSASPGTAKADNKWTIVRVEGIEDKATLDQMAKDYYHGRNRNEIEIAFKTKNFSSFGGGNQDPDLLDMKAGDPLEILVDRANDSTIAGAEDELTKQNNEKFLTDLNFEPAFASAYAKTYLNAGFQRIFRMREMDVQGDVDEGVTFEFRCVNLVQVRGEVK
jgi:hypothetical protein